MTAMFSFLISLFFLFEGPEISFTKNRVCDIGSIKEGETAEVHIGFKNSGNQDLLILSAITTCNCTSVDYPKKAIKPGEEGHIIVRVNTKGKFGKETTVVKIMTNSKNQYEIIRVDMDVVNQKSGL